jgi:asparagine synthase (glutamine-hydrolysing)
VPAPLAIIRDVKKLEPGHFLECDADGGRVRRYWTPTFAPKRHVDFNQAVSDVRALVQEAVRVRLESDVPLGTFLSGGIDSSIVTSVMAAETSRPVKTFSIGFTEAAYDERPYARLVADTFRTEHHELVVEMDAMSALPELAQAYDEPFADSSALPTFYVSRLTRQHVTVALSGDGGDEVFGGYERYAATVLAERAAGLAQMPVLRELGDAAFLANQSPEGRSVRRRLQRFWEGARISDTAERYAAWMTGMSPAVIERLYPDGRNCAPAVSEYLMGRFNQPIGPGTDDLDRMQRLDMLTYLPEDLLVKVDRASMANSLEVRAPLLDHRLIEYVARLPSTVRTPRLRLKGLLKAAFPEIPRQILDRRKTGFGVPVAAWFRQKLGEMYVDVVLAPHSRCRDWFDPQVLADLLDEHRRRVSDHSVALWTLLTFEHWHRTHLG